MSFGIFVFLLTLTFKNVHVGMTMVELHQIFLYKLSVELSDMKVQYVGLLNLKEKNMSGRSCHLRDYKRVYDFIRVYM